MLPLCAEWPSPLLCAECCGVLGGFTSPVIGLRSKTKVRSTWSQGTLYVPTMGMVFFGVRAGDLGASSLAKMLDGAYVAFRRRGDAGW